MHTPEESLKENETVLLSYKESELLTYARKFTSNNPVYVESNEIECMR